MNALLRAALYSILALILGANIALADIKIGVAAEPYPPFSSKDSSGKWVGWEIDLMEAVCKQINEKCELIEVAWDGIIPALTSKQIDVIWSSMAITNERKKTIDFTNMYYKSPPAIVGIKDGNKDISPKHLSGKIVGAQVSTIHERYLRKHYPESEIKIYQTQDEANNDLAAGRLDYVQAASSAVAAFLQTEQGQSCCEIKGIVPDDPNILGEGVGGGVRKEDTELKGKLNTALTELSKSGALRKITERYPELAPVIVLPTL